MFSNLTIDPVNLNYLMTKNIYEVSDMINSHIAEIRRKEEKERDEKEIEKIISHFDSLAVEVKKRLKTMNELILKLDNKLLDVSERKDIIKDINIIIDEFLNPSWKVLDCEKISPEENEMIVSCSNNNSNNKPEERQIEIKRIEKSGSKYYTRFLDYTLSNTHHKMLDEVFIESYEIWKFLCHIPKFEPYTIRELINGFIQYHKDNYPDYDFRKHRKSVEKTVNKRIYDAIYRYLMGIDTSNSNISVLFKISNRPGTLLSDVEKEIKIIEDKEPENIEECETVYPLDEKILINEIQIVQDTDHGRRCLKFYERSLDHTEFKLPYEISRCWDDREYETEEIARFLSCVPKNKVFSINDLTRTYLSIYDPMNQITTFRKVYDKMYRILAGVNKSYPDVTGLFQ